jgi:hypothetical protein
LSLRSVIAAAKHPMGCVDAPIRLPSATVRIETGVSLGTVKSAGKKTRQDPWRVNEEARRRQLRDDGRRSLATNLSEGLALSEYLSTFTGSARPR